MFIEKWNKLVSIGVNFHMNQAEKREIKMLNVMSVFAIGINILLSFVWIFLEAFKYSAINYSMAVVLVGVIILNSSGNFNLARGFFFITILLHIASISVLFDLSSEYYLFPLIIIAGFIFQKKKHLLLFVAITLIVYLFMAGDFLVPDHLEFKTEHSPMVNFIDGVVAIGFTVVALNQFLSMAESNRREIVVKNKLLEETVNIAKERAEYSELLLKEMNHRVKNNLQMISSLLNIHADRSKSKIARQALLDAQNRIYSISLIHKQLYVEDNFTKIDIAKYVDELIPFVKESFPLREGMLEIKSLCTHISLDIEEAVSLGLILNELLTNSVAHGAIEGRKLVIKILVYYMDNNELFVSVESNGKRLDKIKLLNSKHFGIDLVEALASSFDGQMLINEDENRISLKLKIGMNDIVDNNK